MQMSELLRVYREITGQCDFHRLSVQMAMCLKREEKQREKRETEQENGR
jgi:hypothetical protein